MAETIDLILALSADRALQTFDGFVNKISAGNRIAAVGTGLTKGLTVPIVAGLGLATSKAIEFNSAIGNSARSLDLSRDETEAFRGEVLKLAPSLGLLPAQFADVAGAAGKLGVQKNEIAEFGRVLGTLATISDTPIEQFTQKAGTIKTVFNLNTKETEIFGAAVNKLDDAVGGSTPNIMEFTSRVAAVGKNMGFSASEVAAFGSVFETVGLGPDRAATAFQNFANQLFTINAATPKAKEAFESLGYSAEEFGQVMARDPKRAVIEFLDKVNGIEDPVRKSTVLLEIFGKESGSAIASLATQSGKLNEAFKLTGDTTGNLAKMNSEFAAKMKDPAIQAKVLQSQMESIGISIGTVMIPVLTQAIGVLMPVVESFGAFLALNPEWAKLIVMVAGFAAVIGPTVALVGTLIGAFTTVAGWAGVVWGSITSLAGGFSLLISVVGGVTVGIGTIITVMGGVVVAVGALAAAFFFNWGGIRDKTVWLGNALLSTFTGAMRGVYSVVTTGASMIFQGYASLFSRIISGVGQLSGHVINSFSSMMSRAASAVASSGSYVYSAVVNTVNRIPSAISSLGAACYNAGLGLMRQLASGIQAMAGHVYSQAQNVVGSVRNLLPFSPAKEGPLKDLDKSGESLFRTFANNLDPDYLRSKINQGLENLGINARVEAAMAPATATAGAPTRATIPAPVGIPGESAAPLTVNFTQNVEISASMSASEIMDTLKRRQREFLDLIRQAEFFTNRKQS